MTPYLEVLPARLDGADVHHLGILCQLIRESRGISRQAMARACDVEDSTIAHFENKGSTAPRTMERYIATLADLEFVGHFYPPLSPQQVAQLQQLYRQYRTKSTRLTRQQQHLCNLAILNFNIIDEQPLAQQFVARLAADTRPAIVTDALGFIYAINDLFLRLFKTSLTHPIFNTWVGWHKLAMQIPQDSPFRLSQRYSHLMPIACADFVWSRFTSPHLFTPQMRLLLQALRALSRQELHIFHEQWPQIISLQPQPTLGRIPRIIHYDGTDVVFLPTIEGHLAVADGDAVADLYYEAWNPEDSELTRLVLAEVQHTSAVALRRERRASNPVFRVTEKRNYQTFHVNDWSEGRKVYFAVRGWDTRRYFGR